MTSTETLEKIRNYILNGDHSDGIIAPILNWCDEILESPKMREAKGNETSDPNSEDVSGSPCI